VSSWLLFCLACAAAEPVSIVDLDGRWSIEPFRAGFALLEPLSAVTYGRDWAGNGQAHFPTGAVTGEVTLPVFLVDWSDFNPRTDESNHDNPGSVFPSYIRSSPESLSDYLNASNGVAGYFRAISGGQLQVVFEVFPWLESATATYLADKEPAYYRYSGSLGAWIVDRDRYVRDVLRSAVVDLGVDLTRYDADGNRVLDGFVIVYEGIAGALAGTNLGWTNPLWYLDPPGPGLDHVADLVATNDPHYAQFAAQPILFSRHVNIPEQYMPDGPGAEGAFSSVKTWAHEIGHLLLGYRDYYTGETDLGFYALSARAGRRWPLHASAMEKWMFGGWIGVTDHALNGTVTVDSHHARQDDTYNPAGRYLYRLPAGDDPRHYLLLENRFFRGPAEGGGLFELDDPPEPPPESGLVVFEVDRRRTGSDQVYRLRPPGADPDPSRCGTLGPGEVLEYVHGDYAVRLSACSAPATQVTVRVDFPARLRVVTAADGARRLLFGARTGHVYTVEYGAGPSTPAWQALPGAPHNSGDVLDAAATDRRFYRVVSTNAAP
jgi:M6 family metalloprotease-like protein